MKLEHPARVWRAAAWLVCAAASAYMAVPLMWRWISICLDPSPGGGRSSFDLEWWMSMRWMMWGWPRQGPFRRTGYWGDLSRIWDQIEYADYPWWFLPLAVMCSVSPAVFVLAPWTRARARVELRHVARWWLYGQGWIPVLFMWLIGVAACTAVQDFGTLTGRSVIGSGIPPTPSMWYEALDLAAAPSRSMVVVPGLWFLWLLWWNWCALKMGMRLDAAGRIWTVLMVPTILAGVLVAVVGVFWLGIQVPWVR